MLLTGAQAGGGTGETAASGPSLGSGTTANDNAGFQVSFANLRLELGDRIRVTRPPILNFVATGNLIINGTLDAPLPNGVITLKSGQVNLFTTQFNLERGYPKPPSLFQIRDSIPI